VNDSGSSSAVEFQEVLQAALRLPVCDRAAKLHALIARVMNAIETGSPVGPVAEALASAATEALADDPWVQFESAARRFKSGHPLAPASLTQDLVLEREGHALQRLQSPLD
jgi:hypothetical protein